MREHDELAPDAAVSLQQHLVPSSADDQAETHAESRPAPPDTPPRQKGILALLAAVTCTVLGAKLITISALGSPVPLMDQWDAEAAKLYSPYLKGSLSFTDLFARHNEHRIVLTRLLGLLQLELAGGWSPVLEMVLGALVLAAVITWLTALLLPLVAPQRRMLLACFAAFVFAFPIGYENVLCGFQSQVYLALLFGIGALVALVAARPFSLRWLGGLAAAVLSYFSFATGVATILAAVVLVGLQLATNARKRYGRERAAVVVIALLAAAMVLWAASRPNPSHTPWAVLEGVLILTAMTIAGAIPAVWFCRHTLLRRPAISDPAWLIVGIAVWLGIQLALLAYGRGNLIAIRYMDIVLLVYPLGLVALLLLGDRLGTTRFRRYAGPTVVTWVFAVAAILGLLGYASVLASIEWRKATHQQEINVRAYLATGNVNQLEPKGERGIAVQIYYPHPQRLADLLRDPDVKAILPAEIRPADADNAGARNRMLLKGALAGVTATAVHLMTLIGPALLALGVGLFFAIGARQSLSGTKP